MVSGSRDDGTGKCILDGLRVDHIVRGGAKRCMSGGHEQ